MGSLWRQPEQRLAAPQQQQHPPSICGTSIEGSAGLTPGAGGGGGVCGSSARAAGAAASDDSAGLTWGIARAARKIAAASTKHILFI